MSVYNRKQRRDRQAAEAEAPYPPRICRQSPAQKLPRSFSDSPAVWT